MNMSSGSKVLRNKIKENPILKIGGAFDAMSAKLVENRVRVLQKEEERMQMKINEVRR